MSTNKSNAIENAEIIIERFGGIRPMASKINVPVTTVQGWKKRNVIPGTRRADIMNAAQDLNIDLTDVLSGAPVSNQNKETAPKKVAEKSEAKANTSKKLPSPRPKTDDPYEAVEAKAKSAKPEGIKAVVNEDSAKAQAPKATDKAKGAPKKPQSSAPKASLKPKTDADVLRAVEETSKKTMINTIWIVTGLMLLTALLLYLFLSPSKKVMEQQQ